VTSVNLECLRTGTLPTRAKKELAPGLYMVGTNEPATAIQIKRRETPRRQPERDTGLGETNFFTRAGSGSLQSHCLRVSKIGIWGGVAAAPSSLGTGGGVGVVGGFMLP